MQPNQIDIEELMVSDQLIQKTYSFPKSQELVHDAAHEMVLETMTHGKASNGLNTWMNKEPLDYHVRKGFIHMTRVVHNASLESRENEEPNLFDLFNGVTRFAMAWALHRMSKKPKEVFIENLDE